MTSAASRSGLPWLMLLSRSALFAVFGNVDGWGESARWWVFVAILANLVSITLLVCAFRAEGKRYLDALRFSRQTVKTDLLWFLGSAVIGLPITAAPMGNLALALFGNTTTPVTMMFRPLPAWALVIGLLFPLTIAFAELPTYFGYVMPRLAAQLKNGWVAWLLASLFLAAQHVFLPFIPDGRFVLWRLGMYLPFALFAGLVLKLRPQLLPYLAIIHALMDISALSVYLMV